MASFREKLMKNIPQLTHQAQLKWKMARDQIEHQIDNMNFYFKFIGFINIPSTALLTVKGFISKDPETVGKEQTTAMQNMINGQTNTIVGAVNQAADRVSMILTPARRPTTGLSPAQIQKLLKDISDGSN